MLDNTDDDSDDSDDDNDNNDYEDDGEVMVGGRWVKPHQPSSIKDSTLPLWQ